MKEGETGSGAKYVSGDVDWENVRGQFRLSADYLHFAQFFIVSHPRIVREAIEKYREQIDDNPFLAVEHGMFGTAEQNLSQRVYRAAAEYVGGKPDEIALVPNTTTGLALVYHGLPLRAGDEILTTTHDHFTQHESIRLAAARAGATWRCMQLFEDTRTPSMPEMLDRLRREVRPETRVLGLTWVHSNTGLRLPIRPFAELIAEINAQRPIDQHVRLVVDGTHGFGALDENVADMGCDFFISSTHKWLFAPRGTGIIWARAENWARHQPIVPTYYSWDLWEAWTRNATPPSTRAEYVSPGGFLAYEHQWAMVEAFEFQRAIGRDRIEQRILDLNGALVEGLGGISGVTVHTPRERRWQSGIVCFDVDGMSPDTVVAELLKQKIIASTTPYAVSYARLSAGIMNTFAEIDIVIAAVRELAGRSRAA